MPLCGVELWKLCHEQSEFYFCELDYCHNSTQSSVVNLLSPVQLISKVELNYKSGIRD